MLIDCLFVERVNLRGVSAHPHCGHVRGHPVKLGSGAPCQMNNRALPGERAGDSSTDRSSASVDNGVLSFEQLAALGF
ncbi:hypothetical protein GCM10023178_70440 [Actinomadura luteofluorescens]